MEPRAAAEAAPTSRRSISLRRSLFLRFGVLAGCTIALLAAGYVLFGLQPVVERIARSHFSTAVEKVDARLEQLFSPVAGLIGMSREWARHPGFDVDRPEEFNRFFQPILRQFTQVTSVVAGDTAGRGWMLLELPEGRWRNRFTDVERNGKLQRFIDWDAAGGRIERREAVDYDPRARPWFRLAMSGRVEGAVHWTEPYVFFTTRDPGITGSSRVELPDGRTFVIGFDIKLLDVSRATASLTVGRSGYVMVLTGDGLVLGMPRNGRGGGDHVIRTAVLKPVEMLEVPGAGEAVARWRAAGRSVVSGLRFSADGEEWLASFRPFLLGDQVLWVAALAPARDFVPPWGTMMAALGGIVVAVLLLALAMARSFTRQFSAPLEALAATSERIARLDFSAAAPADSALKELQQLATAQERMRGMLSTFRDTVHAQSADLKQQIAQLRATEARLAHMSQHDPLTDLPNRVLFNDRLAHAITRARRSKQLFALVFVDLDNFKTINDTRGHEAGDRLLVQVAARLRREVREEDSVARLGGDEFVVLIEDLSAVLREAAVQAEAVAEKIRAALSVPYVLDTVEYVTTASIGVTLYRSEDDTADQLLRGADVAMYKAKRAGRDTVRFFDPAMQAELEAAARLELDLRHALPERQLVLHFQAQFAADRTVTGAEALLRWIHPGRGMVSPGEFIPVAEESGLILPIGIWVLEAACEQLKAWASSPRTRRLHLAVNVSPRQFRHPSFVEDVTRVLERTGADPRCLVLELTEGMVLENIADAASKMLALKTLGIRLSMDDFGTGYSSLSYLSRLPLDEVKIDQSFVRNLGSISGDAAIVQAILSMARSLGLRTVAEGVESREQFDWLVGEGCTGYQGYLFCRPAPAADLDALLADTPPEVG